MIDIKSLQKKECLKKYHLFYYYFETSYLYIDW